MPHKTLTKQGVAQCGSMLVTRALWPIGHKVTHPVHGTLYLVQKFSDGSMLFTDEQPVAAPSTSQDPA